MDWSAPQGEAEPLRASEDFGRSGNAKSAMLWLSAGETRPQVHNPDYDFPENNNFPVELGNRVAAIRLKDRRRTFRLQNRLIEVILQTTTLELMAAQRLLGRATPIQFDLAPKQGRTRPSFITCELPTGEIVEVVAKFSGGCDQGNVNLAREVVGACLATDLGLPVPEPILIEVTPEWAETVPDTERRSIALRSSPVAFGSRLATRQFDVWKLGNVITERMVTMAAAIFVFDAIIQNPDRRSTNPNCLVRGDELLIFDHELAFSHELVLGWTPPWSLGGLKSLEINGNHIFRAGLRGHVVDYEAIRKPWNDLTDEDIAGLQVFRTNGTTSVAPSHPQQNSSLMPGTTSMKC